jgi:hypothetical protein
VTQFVCVGAVMCWQHNMMNARAHCMLPHLCLRCALAGGRS